MRKTITRLTLVIVSLAFSLAGSYVPEWTDHNESDPGITLFEVLP